MRSTFFSLPRELRDTVYHHYIFEPDGYHFNVESGKFRASGNRPIDLALSLASKSVAAEMHHLALERNVLNFWTSDFRRQEAGRFNALFEQMLDDKSWLLRTLQDPQFGRYKTSEVDKKVAQEYPQLEPLLLDLNNGSWGASIYRASNGGVAESCTRGFLDYLVEVLSRDTNFIKAWGDAYGNDASSYEKRIVPFAKSTLFLSSPEPWAMPSRYELAKMSEVISPRSILERRKWRFSAAAVAINFLNSIPQTTLMKIRKIVLHENRRSVGRPECHGLGLIPFCSQNPKLHMEVSKVPRSSITLRIKICGLNVLAC